MESDQLLQESDKWLAELESKFPKRNFMTTVVNLEGVSIFVTRYIKALQPPTDIPADDVSIWHIWNVYHLCFSLLSGELLAEHCRTDDLMPSIPVLCLPPSRVDPKVLGLNVVIYHSQPGGSWTTRRSPPIRWWSQRGGDDTVASSSGADQARCPKNLNRNDLTFSETGKQPVMLLTVSFVVCLVYGIRKIFRRHQVSKASRRFAVSCWRSMSRTHRGGLGGCRSYGGAP